MNISRLSQTPANLPNTPARSIQSQPKVATTADEAVEKKRHGTSGPVRHLPKPVAGLPEVAEDGLDVPEDHNHDHSTRVANYASRIETRLQNAIQGGHLSDEQATSLKAAAEQFHALMQRISNADFSHSPKRQVLFALGQLHNQIHAIFQPQGGEQLQPGSSVLPENGDVGTPKSAPSIDAVA